MSYKEFYKELVDLVNVHKDDELENKDLLFLFSLKKNNLMAFLEGNDPDLKRPPNAFLLNDNLYSDFLKLIKVPSFIYRIKDLITDYSPKITNKFKDNFLYIFKQMFEISYTSDDELTDTELKKTRNFDYIKYFLINGRLDYNSASTDDTLLFAKVIPMILFSMYLECSIYIYTNIIDDVNKAFDITLKIGTFDYTSAPPNPAITKQNIQADVYSWMTLRCNIYNKLNNTTKKPKMYDINKNQTLDQNKFEYFNLFDLYSKDEILKIEYLSMYRHELINSHSYDGSVSVPYVEFEKERKQYFSNNFVKVPNRSLRLDVATVNYLIFQAIHAYDQIIKEMVNVRLSFLNQARNDINTDKGTNTLLKDNAPKMISTLKQFVNYPLTFQYKFKKFESCYTMISENNMKNMLNKYIKLAILKKYFIKNFGNYPTNPLFNDPTNITTISNAQITSLNISEQFIWDSYAQTSSNFKAITHLLINMNQAEIDINDNISQDLSVRTTYLISCLKTILESFNKQPYKSFSPGHSEYYKTIYQVKAPLSMNGDGVINTILSNLNTIIYTNSTNTMLLKYSMPGNPDVDAYYKRWYKTKLDDFNNLKNKYCQKLHDLYTRINYFVNALALIYSNLEQYITRIKDIRDIIDKGSDVNWSNSYIDSSNIFTAPSGISISTTFINYSNASEIKPGINFKLTKLNNDLIKTRERLIDNINRFNTNYTKSVSLSDELMGSDNSELKTKLSNFKSTVATRLKNLKDTEIQQSQDKIDLLKAEHAKITTNSVGNDIFDKKALITAEESKISTADAAITVKQNLITDANIKISAINTTLSTIIPPAVVLLINKTNYKTPIFEPGTGNTYDISSLAPLLAPLLSAEYDKIVSLESDVATENAKKSTASSKKLTLSLDISALQAKADKKLADATKEYLTVMTPLLALQKCSDDILNDSLSNITKMSTFVTDCQTNSRAVNVLLKGQIKTHMDNVLFKVGDFSNLNAVANRMTDAVSALMDYIKILNKTFAIDTASPVKTDFALHRIKMNLFKLIVSAYNTNTYSRHEETINRTDYDVNHTSASLELVSCELFKNNKGVNIYYAGLNRTEYMSNILNIDDSSLVSQNAPIRNLPDISGDDILQEHYLKDLRDFYTSKKKTFATTNECSKFKFIEEDKIGTGAGVDVINNRHNISVYQLLDYFNSNPVLNMCEILYNYLVALREIPEIPSIDELLNMLKQPGYVNPFNIVPTRIYIQDGLRNYATYNSSNATEKNNNVIRQIFTNIMDSNEIDYLLNNLRPIVLNPLNDKYLLINTDDIQNRIHFNPKKLIELINSFNEETLITYMFKTYRDANVEISNNNYSKPVKLVFDDLAFYRCEIPKNYRLDNIRKYYASYFSLGIVSDKLIQFSNKINDVVVDILELTNGRF